LLVQLLTRLKVLAKRTLATVGVREEVGLIPVAVTVGAITALLAVAFHELIEFLKRILYEARGGDWLYGSGLWALVALPAVGGLVVGLVSRYLIRSQGSHGVVDVIESVLRTRGFVRPITAIEKIFTSAITIGSGGSCGAEGPIVQIGAAVSSFVGSLVSISRQRMPLLVGCGTAAGISSIFHSPIGGVLFTLEVILRDFSVRTLVPVVVASVVANVVTDGAFHYVEPEGYRAIFAAPMNVLGADFSVNWSQAAQFAVLGLLCGVIGATQTKLMLIGERAFAPLKRIGPFRPAVGGALLGGLGVLYVLLFGWLLHTAKPIPFKSYPMPAFFGDGYGVVKTMLDNTFAQHASVTVVITLLAALIALKLLGTTLTLCSGGSGGIIAPALFLGATAGLLLGKVLVFLGFDSALPTALAVVGMGAVLAAVVHAPLALILIVFELTQTPGVIVPAMLATVTAHGIARMVLADSVYTVTLRQRGLSAEAAADMPALRKFAIDHLPLEPIVPLFDTDPIQRAIDLAGETDRSNFIVTDKAGKFRGLITSDQLQAVLMQEEAIPLLTCAEVMRTDIRPLRHTENLASLFDAFIVHDIDALPVGLEYDPTKTIGIATRDALLRHYRKHWKEN
jgi:CIC family chloride channel protein